MLNLTVRQTPIKVKFKDMPLEQMRLNFEWFRSSIGEPHDGISCIWDMPRCDATKDRDSKLMGYCRTINLGLSFLKVGRLDHSCTYNKY